MDIIISINILTLPEELLEQIIKYDILTSKLICKKFHKIASRLYLMHFCNRSITSREVIPHQRRCLVSIRDGTHPYISYYYNHTMLILSLKIGDYDILRNVSESLILDGVYVFEYNEATDYLDLLTRFEIYNRRVSSITNNGNYARKMITRDLDEIYKRIYKPLYKPLDDIDNATIQRVRYETLAHVHMELTINAMILGIIQQPFEYSIPEVVIPDFHILTNVDETILIRTIGKLYLELRELISPN